MTGFTLNSVSKAAVQTRNVQKRSFAQNIARRWLHGSMKRQAIMMPAMSPLMTEGTITRWKKKEGEAFAPGDVLLQIESDIYMIDVEAHSPGILGKILMPDGTTNVPVEQIIALVARTPEELATLQTQHLAPSPPPLNPIPSAPSMSMSPFSPRPTDQFRPMLTPRSPRTPSLFELQSMGMGHRTIGSPMLTRAFSTGDSRPLMSPGLPEDSGSPVTPTQDQIQAASRIIESTVSEDKELDGAAIRRMIVNNLSRNSIPQTDDFHDFL
ncbi:single hybrid motif-containing protein [Crucibulum laeve]|uniref:Single hybrid motif-containing protein n=1 Tax=Crucibulum laeve TaxID=68775 RepID=A0A5C3LR76_9AGAR|nr:single hybrid motif-containing protein [Crucibulum laeve]